MSLKDDLIVHAEKTRYIKIEVGMKLYDNGACIQLFIDDEKIWYRISKQVYKQIERNFVLEKTLDTSVSFTAYNIKIIS